MSLPSPQNELAILIDGVVHGQPPIVQSAITNGQGVITGNFTRAVATSEATILSAAALAAPLRVTSRSATTVHVAGSPWGPDS